MKFRIIIFAFTTSLFVLSSAVSAQIASGGSYTFLQTVIGAGGGVSQGPGYLIEGTIGQPVAGDGLTGGSYTFQSGFWNLIAAPTAAGVSVSGRVTTPDGRGLRNAVVRLTDSHNVTRTVMTGSSGYYTFDSVGAGESYVIGVSSKIYRFSPRLVQVFDSLTGVDFVAAE